MKILYKLCVSLIILNGFIGCSQTKTSDKEEIEKVVAELYNAMVDKNEALLKEHTAESLTYGHSSGTIENKSEYIDAVLHGGFDFDSIEGIDQTVSITNEMGIVRHKFVAKGINSGELADVRIGCMLVFQNQDGNWKLLARQAYKL